MCIYVQSHCRWSLNDQRYLVRMSAFPESGRSIYCYLPEIRGRSEIVLEPATDRPEIVERIGIEFLVIHSDRELLAAAEIDKSAGAP